VNAFLNSLLYQSIFIFLPEGYIKLGRDWKLL
jgi:hypothetical protein